MVSFVLGFPLEEVLKVEDLKEPPLTEEEPPIFTREPRLQCLPPLLLDVAGATMLGRSSTMMVRQGEVAGLEQTEDMEVITEVEEEIESKTMGK